MSQLKVNSIIPVSGVPTGGGGGIIQVVSTTKSDNFTTTNSSFTDITGFSATITPISTSSKILVLFGVFASNSTTGGRFFVRMLRGTDAICIGDQRGNRTRVTGTSETAGGGGNMKCFSGNHLDSPATASAITYKLQFSCPDGGTTQLNASNADSDSSSYGNTASYLTVMEVSA